MLFDIMYWNSVACDGALCVWSLQRRANTATTPSIEHERARTRTTREGEGCVRSLARCMRCGDRQGRTAMASRVMARTRLSMFEPDWLLVMG